MTRKYVVQDDSVTVRGAGHPEYAGKSITRRAETFARQQRDEGRVKEGGDAGTGRPRGRSTPRDYTGVNPGEPIDPKMPLLPTS